MTIHIILLTAMVVAALATVMTARVMRAALGLALTSAFVSALMFELGAPLAAVFELSVCAGLIPAIFISTIGLTRRLTPETLAVRRREKLKMYAPLPLLVVVAAIALSFLALPMNFPAPAPATEHDVRTVLWNLRHVDLIGQVMVLSAGALGIVILLKEQRND